MDDLITTLLIVESREHRMSFLANLSRLQTELQSDQSEECWSSLCDSASPLEGCDPKTAELYRLPVM